MRKTSARGRARASYRRPSHLSVLQRVQPGVVRRADDLRVLLVGRGSESRSDVVTRQTLGVADGVILPGVKGQAVQRPLQNPVAWWGDSQLTVRQADRQSVRQSAHLVVESWRL